MQRTISHAVSSSAINGCAGAFPIPQFIRPHEVGGYHFSIDSYARSPEYECSYPPSDPANDKDV